MDGLGNYASAAAAARLTGGELMLDTGGMPDFFSVLSAGSEKAFIVGGSSVSRVLVGKYECTQRLGCLCSAPMETPKTYLRFDDALGLALSKGLGYHLMTLAEWAMLCARSSGVSGHVSAGEPTVTGSGAWAYAHNGRWSGVWDLAGNVREWVSGYRTVDGEIQIIPDNDAAAAEADELSETGTLWRAISAAGELVAPGTSGTLKWRYLSGTTRLDTTTVVENTNRTARLESVQISGSVGQTALELLGSYGIRPGMTGVIGYNTSGERLAAAGACYADKAAEARVLMGTYARAGSSPQVGARVCYIAEIT